jgi:hypothetical protein
MRHSMLDDHVRGLLRRPFTPLLQRHLLEAWRRSDPKAPKRPRCNLLKSVSLHFDDEDWSLDRLLDAELYREAIPASVNTPMHF